MKDVRGRKAIVFGWIRARAFCFRTLFGWSHKRFGLTRQTVKPAAGQKGFAVLPRRSVVERTFAWLNNHRPLSKDYERETKTSEAFIQIALMRLMLRRLCPK